jgi:hypothetical protein
MHGTPPWKNTKPLTVQTRAGKKNQYTNLLCPSQRHAHTHLLLFSNLHVSRWYNVPPKSTSQPPPPAVDNRGETDSQPINFDTFVPTHDPSLSAATEDGVYNYIPGVSQDEAFERAVQASYWSGYWTAVYHVCLLLSHSSH